MTYVNKFKGKIPPNVWDEDRLEFWNNPKIQSVEIQHLAMGQSREEILDYYFLDDEILQEHDYDAWFFEVNFRRGRMLAKQNATASLFDSMKGNSAASLAYLTRFGKEEWQSDSGTSASHAAEIKVVLDTN